MSDCPRCRLSKPAEWCWNNDYMCPLNYPPRHVDARTLLQHIRMLQERVAVLERVAGLG
jgi:hypothetical protein